MFPAIKPAPSGSNDQNLPQPDQFNQMQVVNPCPGLDYNLEALACVEATGLIDTHCHLDFIFRRLHVKEKYFPSFKAFKQQYIKEFPEKSFSGCIAVFCEPSKWGRFGYEDAVKSDPDVWCTFGIHPHHSDDFEIETWLTLEELLKR